MWDERERRSLLLHGRPFDESWWVQACTFGGVTSPPLRQRLPIAAPRAKRLPSSLCRVSFVDESAVRTGWSGRTDTSVLPDFRFFPAEVAPNAPWRFLLAPSFLARPHRRASRSNPQCRTTTLQVAFPAVCRISVIEDIRLAFHGSLARSLVALPCVFTRPLTANSNRSANMASSFVGEPFPSPGRPSSMISPRCPPSIAMAVEGNCSGPFGGNDRQVPDRLFGVAAECDLYGGAGIVSLVGH